MINNTIISIIFALLLMAIIFFSFRSLAKNKQGYSYRRRDYWDTSDEKPIFFESWFDEKTGEKKLLLILKNV